MSWMDRIKGGMIDLRNNLTTEVKRFKSKDLMRAIVAGSTLIAYADGTISAEEKQKLIGFFKQSDELKVFNTEEVIAAFQSFVAKFEFDASIGEGEVLKEVAKFKGKPEAELIVKVCMAIAKADGNFDADEKAAVGRVCGSLDLNPAQYA